LLRVDDAAYSRFMHPTASVSVTLGILVLTLLVAWLFVAAQAFAARKQGRPMVKALLMTMLGVGAWLVVTGAMAASGWLLDFESRPPPIAALFVLTLAAGVGLGVSKLGLQVARAVPLYGLVLAQSFRLPLELVMHEAAAEGTMPRAMSFSGYNFDIVTGASAVVVALLIKRGAPLWLAKLWNLVGTALLFAIVVVAFMASPMMRAFGEDQLNTWVAYVPFVWLPTILVTFAIFGHIVVYRRLRSETGGSPP